MARCTTAGYAERRDAIRAKRRVIRSYRIACSFSYCDQCDMYHIKAENGGEPLSERWMRVLLCVAKGYRDEETSKIVEIAPRSVEWAIGEMMKRFSALSRPHLIAITISLGIISPNEFVPLEGEKNHA